MLQYSSALIIICLLFLAGCGSYRPESMESKFAHYNSADKKTNEVPTLTLNFDAGKSRAPSSLSSAKSKKKKAEVNEELTSGQSFSNKKLYFLALFNQYNTLAHFTPSPTEKIKSCPNFHSGIIEQMGEYPDPNVGKTPLEANGFNQSAEALKNMVGLQLPLQKNELHPTVAEFFQSNTKGPTVGLYELQVKALDVHLSKIHDELEELCQFGSSDNYYIFENLATYIQNQKLNMSNESVTILMRTTLFPNQILTNAFLQVVEKGRSPANATTPGAAYFDNVVKRLDVDWVSSFVNYSSTPSSSKPDQTN